MLEDGFDVEDATIIGGIMGFAEESMREENRLPDEPDTEDYEPTSEVNNRHKDLVMRLLENENPGLFAYVVKKVLEHKRKWAEYRANKVRDMADRESVAHEIEAMDKTEEMLESDNAI